MLALKQGVGRLIRSEQDRGVVMICDPRLSERGYGRGVSRQSAADAGHARARSRCCDAAARSCSSATAPRCRVKLLALDTATELCSAALWLEGDCRVREAQRRARHGELILP